MDPVSGLRIVNTVTSDMANIVKTAKAHELLNLACVVTCVSVQLCCIS